MLMLFPLRFIISWMSAAIIHEFCHYIMLRICGSMVYSVKVGMGGAVIQAQPLTAGREALCALAGPVGGLLLMLFSRWIPRIAVCAFLQSLFNLLPIFPMDGGRAVRGILFKLTSTYVASAVFAVIECLTLLILGVFSFCAMHYLSMGLLPILIYAIVLWKRVKIPCKRSELKLQ